MGGSFEKIFVDNNPIPRLWKEGSKYVKGLFEGSEEETNPYGQLNPEQIEINKQLGSNLKSLLTTGAPGYTGEFTADMTPEEQALYDQTGRLNALAEEGFGNLLKGEFPEEYYQSAIYRPMMKEWTENIQPLLEEQYAGGGSYWGTPRADAVRGGLRDVTDTLAAKRAELGLKAKEWPITAAPAYASYAQGVGNVLATPRLIKQFGLESKYADWLRASPNNATYINAALAFLGQSTGTYKPAEKSMFEQLLPELVKVAATAAGKA